MRELRGVGRIKVKYSLRGGGHILAHLFVKNKGGLVFRVVRLL